MQLDNVGLLSLGLYGKPGSQVNENNPQSIPKLKDEMTIFMLLKIISYNIWTSVMM